MNALTEVLRHPLMYNVGWTLLHFVWQGTAVAAFFALIQNLLRRSSANARYVSGCFALVLMLAAPVATLTVLQSDIQGVGAGAGAQSAMTPGTAGGHYSTGDEAFLLAKETRTNGRWISTP